MAKSISESYKAVFKETFPELVRELTESGLKDPEIADGMLHLQKVIHFLCYFGAFEVKCLFCFVIIQVMNYNVPHGECG